MKIAYMGHGWGVAPLWRNLLPMALRLENYGVAKHLFVTVFGFVWCFYKC